MSFIHKLLMQIIKTNKNGETLIITRSAAETKGKITEYEGFDEPGKGPPMHVHHKQEERIRIIRGKMRVKTREKEFSLSQGEEYTFAPGEAHQLWNEGSETLFYAGHVRPAHNYEYLIRHFFRFANEARNTRPGAFDAAFLLTRYKSEIDILDIPKLVKKLLFPLLILLGKLTGRFSKFSDAPPPVR
jgi:mannose-6-phosphate isomerase-like protein (cupin superfamily)